MASLSERITTGTTGFVKRRRRWLYSIGGVLILYTLFGFFLAPWLVEKAAVDAVSNNLDSELRLEKVAINPYVLSLRVDGLELDDPAGEPLARIGQIFVNFQLSSIFRRAWTFAEIRFDAPELYLSRDGDGALNVLKLAPADESDAPAQTDEPAGMPRVFVYDLSIGDARVHWRDDVPPEPVETLFGPVTVQVLELNTLPDRPGEQDVLITTETAGSLAWSGSIQLNPLASTGHAVLDGSPFPLLSAYLRYETGLDVVDGLVDVELDYAVSAAADGSLNAAVDNLEVVFTNVRVNTFDPAPDDPSLNGRELLAFPELRLRDGRFRWPEREVSASAFELDDAVVEFLRLESGDLDFLRSTGGAEPVDPAEPAGDEASAGAMDEWQLSLDRFAIANLTFRLTDRGVEPYAEIGFDALDLSVDSISNEPGASFPTALSLAGSRGGTISLEGTTTVLPEPVLEYDAVVDGIALEAVHPYLQPLADVNLDSGTVDVNGRIRHAPDELLLLEADVDILDFLITETDEGTRLGSWDRLHFDGVELSLTGESLGISEIVAEGPFADILIAADGSVNLGRISKDAADDEAIEENPQAGSEGNETAEGELPLEVTVGRVVISDGAGIFTDESLPLPFTANIAALAGTLSTIATESAEPSAVDLEGKVDEYGLVRITGSVTPLDFARNTNLDVVFENVEMPKFSAYTIPFAGREIASGKLDLDLGYEVRDSRLVGENGIVLREFELGEKVPHPDAMSLPLGLAVALLKDSSGTIDIDLPVRGDINDPEFSYGRVIGKAILNLITKIVTSPFALLGNLVGAEAEDLEYINFVAGRADLAPPELERADKLAEALGLRPQLTLEIQGAVAADADMRALQRIRLEATIEERMASAAEDGDGDENYAERRRTALEALFLESLQKDPAALDALEMQFTSNVVDEESGRESEQFDATAYAAELERQLVDTVEITEADLAELARMRAENSKAAVIAADAGLESRVSVVGGTAETKDGGEDTVRMQVSLSAGE
jgi:hypothetical protein